MTHALLGRKVEMMQVFDDDGNVVPVTVIEAGPCPVVQIKTKEKDGYQAIQIAFEPRKKNIKKPQRGQFKKSKLAPHKHLREVRLPDGADVPVEVGQELTISMFEPGDIVDIVGTTKGKGFQGTIKRHNFARGPMSHGSMNVRRPGSIGQASDPSRVFKGVKMAGQMGNKRATVRNLEVVRIDSENNLIFIKGGIPGPNGGLVMVRDSTTKARKEQRTRPLLAEEASA